MVKSREKREKKIKHKCFQFNSKCRFLTFVQFVRRLVVRYFDSLYFLFFFLHFFVHLKLVWAANMTFTAIFSKYKSTRNEIENIKSKLQSNWNILSCRLVISTRKNQIKVKHRKQNNNKVKSEKINGTLNGIVSEIQNDTLPFLCQMMKFSSSRIKSCVVQNEMQITNTKKKNYKSSFCNSVESSEHELRVRFLQYSISLLFLLYDVLELFCFLLFWVHLKLDFYIFCITFQCTALQMIQYRPIIVF